MHTKETQVAKTGVARVVNPLTPTEISTLSKHEATIKKGQKTFLDVGHALAEIRDDRLYRTKYLNFDEYCKAKWGFSGTHAYRKIAAAEKASQMAPRGETIPATEKQLRALPDDPVEATEVWEDAQAETGEEQPSAPAVKAVVDNRNKKTRRDKDGNTIPESLYPAFDVAEQFDAVLKTMIPRLGEVTLEICDFLYKGERDERKQVKNGFKYSAIRLWLDSVAGTYEKHKPRRVCQECSGDGCGACNARGYTP